MVQVPKSLVATVINYAQPPADGAKPYARAGDTSPNARNWTVAGVSVDVEDVRGKEGDYTLQESGFEYHVAPSAFADWYNDKAVQEQYYPESIELLKKLTGAKRVVIFDHTIRRSIPADKHEEDTPQNRHPALLAHVDQTPSSAAVRVRRHAPEDADELLRGRYQIVNLWRPIEHAALDHPLALCDFRSVDAQKDLAPCTLVFPTYTGETFNVYHSPEQKWKYLRGMRPDEVVLIKCADSDTSGATFTPHTAFSDPTTPEDAPSQVH